MSRPLSNDEIKEAFCMRVNTLIKECDSKDASSKEKLISLAKEILRILDGGDSSLPGFIVSPYPHPSDKYNCVNNNENYFPPYKHDIPEADISGALHQELSRYIT